MLKVKQAELLYKEEIMEIVQYNSHYAQDFVSLNSAWIINTFGKLEKEDIETFQNIEREISNGAMIYFAVEKIGRASCRERVWYLV